jgi:hypothetical protein
MAVTYDGRRLGSWFHSERALKALNANISVRLFAMLRWLKIPVLNDVWRAAMRETVQKNPVDFVRGWLGKDALPTPLANRDAEDGIDVAVREFLWNYSDRSRWRVEDLTAAIPAQPLRERTENDVIALKCALMRLGDLCPSLAYNFARTRMDNKFTKHIRTVAVDLISRPEQIDIPLMFSMAARNCASLVGATQQEIEDAVGAYANGLEGRATPTGSQAFYLRRLGETESGRRYIAGALLFRLSERGLT